MRWTRPCARCWREQWKRGSTAEAIGELLAKLEAIPPVTMVEVAAVDLSSLELLCTGMAVRQWKARRLTYARR